MSPTVAVLAGGLATRLRPITESVPKSLIPIGDRPFAVYQLELLERHGLTDIVFLVGHLGAAIREALGDGSRWGVRVRYVFEGDRLLGTGGAVAAALPALSDPFFVLYGDSYLECDYQAVHQAFVAGGNRALMTVCRNDDRWDRSNVRFADGRIVQYDKQHRTADMRHIDYGLGIFRKSAFAGRPSGQPFDLAAVYQDLLRGGDLAGYEVAGRFYEIGSPAGIEETRAHLCSMQPTRP